jgi:phosphatidylglycerol---prolipoprotein diacylglyceryl transferase
MILDYLIWNGSPEIFTYGWLSLRWYGLLFALGFLLSQQILYYMHKRDKIPQGDVDTLTIYMVIATILGARLGHIIFYQPEIFTEDPLGVLLPFQFSPEFKFTGLQGLASHGAAFGILFALWIYTNYYFTFSGKTAQEVKAEQEEQKENITKHGKASTKPTAGQVTATIAFGAPIRDNVADVDSNAHIRHKIKKGFNFIKRVKPGQSYIQTLDRIVILVTLTGALIRLGNFFNSEIIGKPTDAISGVVFINEASEMFTKGANSPVDFVKVKSNPDAQDGPNGRKPMLMYLFFKTGVDQVTADNYIEGNGPTILANNPEFIDYRFGNPIPYNVVQESNGIWVGRLEVVGIARHPSQLYESISCFVFFLFLFWLWARGKVQTQPGLIFGIFMIVLWTLRFIYEFNKENQVDFENTLPINMGQILSIPLIIVGIVIIVKAVQGKFVEQKA